MSNVVNAELTAQAAPPPAARRPRRGSVLRRLVTSPLGLAALAANLVLLFLVVLGPVLWAEPATTNDVENIGSGPVAGHPFGTDALGRDILARVLVASRLSIGLALAATGMGMALGVVIGSVAAVAGPRVSRLISGFVDIMVAFPGLLLALFFAVIFGIGPQGAVLALGAAMTPSFARLTFTLASSVAGRDFVAAARALGVPRWRILLRHLLPNIGEPLIINGTLAASGSLLAFAGLSFLGLGVQLPQYDWGKMLGDGLNSIYSNPMAALAPGLAIVLASLAFNLTGEAAAQLLGRRVGIAPGRARRLLATALGDRTAPPSPAPAPTGAGVRGGDPATGPVLRVEGLSVAIPVDATTVATPVRGVSLTVAAGEAVGIVGESGSGKTLTAMAIAQLAPPPRAVRTSRLELAGRELTRIDPGTRRRHLGRSLAMVFQDPMSSLNPTMRVGAQLAEYGREHQGLSRGAAAERVVDRLRAVRIPSPARRARQYPHELSGGMRQRVMIAMGLMGEPALIIADEPTTALDVTVQEQVLRLIRRGQDEQGAALLLISHDLSVVSAMCERVLVMYAGRIVETISTEALTTGPAHPYTRGLIATVPDMDSDRTRPLPSIPGRPPHPAAIPAGCAFAPRCPFATEVCRREDPVERPSPTGGLVACHHPQTGPVLPSQTEEVRG